jgi:DNA repair protein RadC
MVDVLVLDEAKLKSKGKAGAGKRVGARDLAKHLKYMVPQVRLALIREPQTKAPPIHCPEDMEKFVEPLKFYSEEHFVSFFLNARNEITGYSIVSHGTVSASLVHPREVFKAAILANAYAIIVAHNHPGGSLTPSREDLETTEKLIDAGKLLGVAVVDHVIVAVSGIYSIREQHSHFWK